MNLSACAPGKILGLLMVFTVVMWPLIGGWGASATWRGGTTAVVSASFCDWGAAAPVRALLVLARLFDNLGKLFILFYGDVNGMH
jgi:hypothetical protein